jgi:hypothetical protein
MFGKAAPSQGDGIFNPHDPNPTLRGPARVGSAFRLSVAPAPPEGTLTLAVATWMRCVIVGEDKPP